MGSSPLTRGKLTFPIMTKGGGGLIPAHAGKTVRGTRVGSSYKAHPRSRGENGIDARRGPQNGGSSPLTRGKQLSFVLIRVLHGLIPAHAGKTEDSVSPQ